MTITELEKEIIKAIKIESKIPLTSEQPYKDLMKFVKKLFKEYRELNIGKDHFAILTTHRTGKEDQKETK